ncbi:hypothetical protein SISSUDRAFT_563825 [Sistotremastrum suecicum HHB10207 ss-3]|uniref:Fungal-type protein kinase domain-containing protein n=1 Tax=Sistotremastrum suecicum HHB10207 ss-3 TaxID=1314776 RepID=A0A166ETF8_9AGAM|nr:hypothetical protein SISSUDRAFT_563825 [Sistotremastrum suecicum HHB10207 ss-3]
MTKKGTLLYMSSWMSNGRKRYGAWAHDDLESFLWVLIVTAFWVKPPSPDYDEWYASVENTMKDCLFRDEPDKDDRIRDIKLSLMIAFSGETRRPFTYHDPVSSQYHEVIKKWCTYMLDRYFARMRRVQEYIVGDEQIYLDVLAILRESIESLS